MPTPKTKLDLEAVESKARAYLLNAKLNSEQVASLDEIGYFTAPASMRHHLNCPGGLMQHSINVSDAALELGAFRYREMAYRFGMLHDLVKCYCYKKAKTGSGYVFAQAPYPGHGICSAFVAADLDIHLSAELQQCIIWHMGAFGLDEDQLKEYHSAIQRFPRSVILSHAADHLASAYIEQNQ